MYRPSTTEQTNELDALIDEALDRFRARAFWWMDRKVRPPVGMVLDGLELHGGHDGLRMAGRIKALLKAR